MSITANGKRHSSLPRSKCHKVHISSFVSSHRSFNQWSPSWALPVSVKSELLIWFGRSDVNWIAHCCFAAQGNVTSFQFCRLGHVLQPSEQVFFSVYVFLKTQNFLTSFLPVSSMFSFGRGYPQSDQCAKHRNFFFLCKRECLLLSLLPAVLFLILFRLPQMDPFLNPVCIRVSARTWDKSETNLKTICFGNCFCLPCVIFDSCRCECPSFCFLHHESASRRRCSADK